MSSDLHELVAPYALDALDADERERFERHLAECERCSAQLGDLQQAAAAMGFATEGPEPPPSLRGRILESARAESSDNVVPFPGRRWAFPAVATVAAAAACLAVGLGIWATSLSHSLDRERSAKAGYARAVELLGGGAQVKPLADAEGGLLVTPGGGDAALVVCGLSRAPAGKTYEAWVIKRNIPHPAGLFRGGSGCPPVLLDRQVPSGAVVAVTLEPEGGVQKPTGKILVHSAAV
ncbi:MAG: anti-sigma factor [Actinomycetota bacterium]